MKLTAKLRLFWDDKKTVIPGAVNQGVYADVWVDVDLKRLEARNRMAGMVGMFDYVEDTEISDEAFDILDIYYGGGGTLPVGIPACTEYGLPNKVRLLDTEWEEEDDND